MSPTEQAIKDFSEGKDDNPYTFNTFEWGEYRNKMAMLDDEQWRQPGACPTCEQGNTMNIFDFVQGQQDCKNGKPHEAGHSLDYDRGYATQYELEQVNNEMRVRK